MSSLRVRLRRVGSSRTLSPHRSAVGRCDDLPKMGETFVMTAPPKGGRYPRLIRIGPVIRVSIKNMTMSFETRHDHYELDLLDSDAIVYA